jgi:hypothetical protein
LKAKATADKKNKDEQKNESAIEAPASSKSFPSPESLGLKDRLAAALASVPTKGLGAEKASPGFKVSVQSKNPATAKTSAPGETLVAAKGSLSGKASSLSKVKSPIPSIQPSKKGTPASQRLSHVSLMGVKSNNKEVVSIPFVLAPCPSELTGQQPSGLHVPSTKDVAPFSSSKFATVKKPSPKKRVSFALEEDLDNETTRNPSPAEGEDWGEPRSGVLRLMTDENGSPVSKSQMCAAMTLFSLPNHILSSTTHADLQKKDANNVSTG